MVKLSKKKEGCSECVLGIDLGTTNCTMSFSWISDEQKEPVIHSIPIPQVMQQGVEGQSGALPSFLYLPLDEEVASGQTCLDWPELESEKKWSFGVFARERGAKVPERLVGSAKSWLCHAGVDRRSALLPQGKEVISPVEATEKLLRYMAAVWNRLEETPDLTKTDVVVTVPASFDPGARQLVQEALDQADFSRVSLVEEPQAAVYAWLHDHESSWRDQLCVGDTILVVDIGGGTTDFSLVKVVDQKGDFGLERISVGDHLLLGGDNMDLALAYFVKQKLEDQGRSIDDWQLQELIHTCRSAKEELLQDDEKEQVEISIQGRGSRLVGKALSCSVTKDEVQNLLVEGFFPEVDRDCLVKKQHDFGLSTVALPFAHDPRVTAHLATFLQKVEPRWILFNGGTMKAKVLQDRVCAVVSSWCSNPVEVLQGADLDQAVGRGAVAYGLASKGVSVRIKSGASRSYFIGVEACRPAIPGIPAPLEAVCVVPLGMEEGTEQSLGTRVFSLTLGSLARFRFFRSKQASVFGQSLRSVQELEELHPVESMMESVKEDGNSVCVQLKSVFTDLGVLELWCQGVDSEKKWKLEFELRDQEKALELV